MIGEGWGRGSGGKGELGLEGGLRGGESGVAGGVVVGGLAEETA